MKRMYVAVLGVLMLGVTNSFAQRLDNNNQYYPKPLPSLEQRKPPYRADDYTKFTAQNAYQEQQIQRKVDEAKAEQRRLEEQKEEEKLKQKAYLNAVDGHKKLVPLYEHFKDNTDWGVYFYSKGLTLGVTSSRLDSGRKSFETTSPVLVVRNYHDAHTIVFNKNGEKIFEWNGNSRGRILVQFFYNKAGERTGWQTY